LKANNSSKLKKLKNSKKRKKRIKQSILLLAIFLGALTTSQIKISKKNIKIGEKNVQNSNQNKEILNYEEENNTIIKESQNNDQTKISEMQADNSIIETASLEVESNKIKEIIAKYMEENNLNSTNFSFFYCNLENNQYYFYNEYTYFIAASTIKVPLAMVYYDKINNNDLSLDTEFLYRSEDYVAGAGETNIKYKQGDYIPLSFLLEQMIVNSDNTATNILKTELGGEKAYRILIKQYTKEDLIEEFNEQNLTSAKYSYDILKRLYDNQEEYKDLIELMKKSSGGEYLKKNIKDCEVAHKYGSYNGYVHDYGIVYDEERYIIGIFTKDVNNAENLIANINQTIIENK